MPVLAINVDVGDRAAICDVGRRHAPRAPVGVASRPAGNATRAKHSMGATVVFAFDRTKPVGGSRVDAAMLRV